MHENGIAPNEARRGNEVSVLSTQDRGGEAVSFWNDNITRFESHVALIVVGGMCFIAGVCAARTVDSGDLIQRGLKAYDIKTGELKWTDRAGGETPENTVKR